MDYNDEPTQEILIEDEEESTEEVVELASIAEEVEAGLWGTGVDCALKLKAAGYNYGEVMAELEKQNKSS